MNTIKRFRIIILLLAIILLFALLISGYIRTTLMWQSKGTVFEGIRPAVGGDLIVNSEQVIYIFAPRGPASLEFAPYEPPPFEEIDNFVPPFKEEWMNDAGETLNRATVRLFRTELNAEPNMLFREYGQRGYWWKSNDLKTIYILVEWLDYTKEPLEPAHLSFWKSINGGKDFTQVKWAAPKLGRGKTVGMYFDSQGINGYIFVNQNTLLQTHDAGETWQKVYIPHTEEQQLPFTRLAIDTATVDPQGNLLFALFKGGNSYIYQIHATNKETDLSQIEAKYQIPHRRLLSLQTVPASNDLYFFYIACSSNEPCTWYTNEEEQQGKQNQPLRFAHFVQGKYTTDQSVGFFLPIKKVYIGEQGKIAVTLTMPNRKDYKLLLSADYGKNWLLEDLSEMITISDYVDLKNNQYWQQRRFNKVFMADGLFK